LALDVIKPLVQIVSRKHILKIVKNLFLLGPPHPTRLHRSRKSWHFSRKIRALRGC
jgi:hypothetical protein